MKTCHFSGCLTVKRKNTYGSSIAEHFLDNRDRAENFSVDVFTILSKSEFSFYLKISETIHISSGRPSLCKHGECLFIFRHSPQYNNHSHPKYFPCFVFSLYFVLYDVPFDFGFVERGTKLVS